VTQIIRLTFSATRIGRRASRWPGLLALALLAVAACTFNPPSGGGTASAPRVNVTEVPRSGASTNTAWVLSTVGLNIHSAPDTQASRVATVEQAVRLNISEKRMVGSDTWLHVKTEAGNAEGWVLDRSDLVIHREVSLHVEQGTGYSILFPADWSPVSGNPATFTGPTSVGGGSMLIQTSDDTTKLMPTPISPGRELRQESPIEVYGRTTFATVYRSDAGGFEFSVKLQFPKTKVAYLFDFKQPGGADADTSLFKQLLGSVIVPGEG
jgi:hypothetical protein